MFLTNLLKTYTKNWDKQGDMNLYKIRETTDCLNGRVFCVYKWIEKERRRLVFQHNDSGKTVYVDCRAESNGKGRQKVIQQLDHVVQAIDISIVRLHHETISIKAGSGRIPIEERIK